MAEQNNIKYSTNIAASSIVTKVILWIVSIIAVFAILLVCFLVALIPWVGTILYILICLVVSILNLICFILILLSTISVCVSKASVTDTGVMGTSSKFQSFSFSFAQIKKIEVNGKNIIITAVNDFGELQGYKVVGKGNAEQFKAACYMQAKRSKEAALATASNEAVAIEGTVIETPVEEAPTEVTE